MPLRKKRTSGSANIANGSGHPGVSEYKAGFNLLQSINCAVLSCSAMSEEHWSELQPSVYSGAVYHRLCSWRHVSLQEAVHKAFS